MTAPAEINRPVTFYDLPIGSFDPERTGHFQGTAGKNLEYSYVIIHLHHFGQRNQFFGGSRRKKACSAMNRTGKRMS